MSILNNNYIKYSKGGISVIEGPFNDFKLEARVHELIEDEDIAEVVSVKGNFEEEREEYLNGIGFTD